MFAHFCGFFIILYSFEFGRSRANKWLFKVIVSFVQTVIIVEPLKVVVISLALAMIIRKIDQSQGLKFNMIFELYFENVGDMCQYVIKEIESTYQQYKDTPKDGFLLEIVNLVISAETVVQFVSDLFESLTFLRKVTD